MKHDLITGNPPFTDGSKGNRPIYQKIIMKCKGGQQGWLVPSSWFHSDDYASFRRWLFDNGLQKIRINPESVFTNAVIFTCIIYLHEGYTGPIEVITNCGASYSYDYRRCTEIVITDSFELTDRIMQNKPIIPYRFINHPIQLKNHKISDSPIKGWSKIVTKLTKDNVHYGWIDLPPASDQGCESHSFEKNLILPKLPCDSHLTWWRVNRFSIIPDDILVCDKYISLKCKTFEEAETIRDYLKSDYCTEIFKWTRSQRSLRNSQFKFIPRIEDASK